MAISPFEIRVAARSDRGRLRPSNEDSLHAAPAPPGREASHGRLFIVADGMGGHAAGEVASAIATTVVAERYYAAPLAPEESPAPALAEAFRAAHEAIRGDADRHAGHRRMGTTCTALLVRGRDCWVAHIGDSRAYLWRHGGLHRLTRDHNLAEDLHSQGRLSDEELPGHPGQHILTRAMGIDERITPEIDAHPRALAAADRLLLCSDGLQRALSDEDVAEILAEPAADAETTAATLVREANERGGPDNVSVVLIECVAAASPPGSPEAPR